MSVWLINVVIIFCLYISVFAYLLILIACTVFIKKKKKKHFLCIWTFHMKLWVWKKKSSDRSQIAKTDNMIYRNRPMKKKLNKILTSILRIFENWSTTKCFCRIQIYRLVNMVICTKCCMSSMRQNNYIFYFLWHSCTSSIFFRDASHRL